jgi:accessory colonization factor AcfC
MGSRLLVTAIVLLGAGVLPRSGTPQPATQALRVEATEAVAPCVRAAAEVFARRGAGVELSVGRLADDKQADVLVASSVEITRAIEADRAEEGSDVDIARIPWVLALEPGAPKGLGRLEDLARTGGEVLLLGGAAAYEARRALAAFPEIEVHETTDVVSLRSASAAIFPLSLATGTGHVALDIPPVVARAAVTRRPRNPAAAAAFVGFLASEEGQRVFAACGAPAGP